MAGHTSFKTTVLNSPKRCRVTFSGNCSKQSLCRCIQMSFQI